MEVFAAGGKVRAGQPHERKARTVRTAADGYDPWSNAVFGKCLFRRIDNMHMRLYFFLHVVIAVAQGKLDGVFAVYAVEVIRKPLYKRLAGFKGGAVVIADYHGNVESAFVAGHGANMVKALVALGVRGRFGSGEHCHQLRSDKAGVLHAVLCAARMDVHAVDVEFCGSGVEVFVFDLAQSTAIHRIRPIGVKSFYIEPVRPAADLLIRGKAHRYPPVLYFRVICKIFERGDDLRDTGFIVRAEKSISVGNDKLAALIRSKAWVFGRVDREPVFEREHTAAVKNGAGLYIVARDGGGGIYMRNKPDRRERPAALGCGQKRRNIAVFINVRIRKPDTFELRSDISAQNKLGRSRRAFRGVFVRIRAERNVFQKSFNSIHHCASPYLWYFLPFIMVMAR